MKAKWIMYAFGIAALNLVFSRAADSAEEQRMERQHIANVKYNDEGDPGGGPSTAIILQRPGMEKDIILQRSGMTEGLVHKGEGPDKGQDITHKGEGQGKFLPAVDQTIKMSNQNKNDIKAAFGSGGAGPSGIIDPLFHKNETMRLNPQPGPRAGVGKSGIIDPLFHKGQTEDVAGSSETNNQQR